MSTPPPRAAPASRVQPETAFDLTQIKKRFLDLATQHAHVSRLYQPGLFQQPSFIRACEPIRQEGAVIAIKYGLIDHNSLFIAANIGVEILAAEVPFVTEVHPTSEREFLEQLAEYEKGIEAMEVGVAQLQIKLHELIACFNAPKPYGV